MTASIGCRIGGGCPTVTARLSRWGVVKPRSPLALLVSLLVAGCETAEVRPSAERPNIVVLFADDLGYGDLGSYGHPTIRTPELDRLAREGQRWTDFYATAPVCSPSRAALLTGRLPVRSGLYGRRVGVFFPNDPGGIPDSELTLAEVLQENGYRTAIFGKWHLGDRPEAWPTRHGFDVWHGIPYSNDMDWEGGPTLDELIRLRNEGRGDEVDRLLAGRRQKYFEPRPEYWNVPLISSERGTGGFEEAVLERSPDQRLLTRQATERAVAFLEQRGEDGRPFFLYVPYSMPHTPIFRSAEFEGRSLAGRYGDVIEEIDWSVGRIRATLEEQQLAENTLVVFTSDNGPWLLMRHHGGSAGLLENGKGTTFEGGMRVPAIFWWPGRVPAGNVVSEIGTAMDLFTTSLAITGTEVPNARDRPSDGVDLSPAIFGTGPSPRTTLPYYRQGELMAFREGRYKIHFVTQGAYSLPPERSEHDPPLLYDLAADPGERYDISSEEPQILQRVIAAADRHRASFEPARPLMDFRVERALANATGSS